MVIDDHQIARVKIRVHGTGSVRQNQHLHAKNTQHSNRERDVAQGVPFIHMASPRKGDDGAAAHFSDDRTAVMTGNPSRRPMGELFIPHRYDIAQSVDDAAKARSEDDGDRRDAASETPEGVRSFRNLFVVVQSRAESLRSWRS